MQSANPLLSGKERCGAALRGHARDDISRVRSGIQCFEELIEGTTEAYPQSSESDDVEFFHWYILHFHGLAQHVGGVAG